MPAEIEYLPLQPMTEADIAAVMAVEIKAYAFPWTERNFLDCLKQNYSCWLYKEKAELLGYAIVMFIVDEMHILNVCIHPQAHGQRLGSRLLATLERIARSKQVETCFLEVRQSNFSAIRLYLNAGFNEIGLRKGYYPAAIGREDAIVMAKTLL